jgi:predicted alpha/beta-fold hydrolase
MLLISSSLKRAQAIDLIKRGFSVVAFNPIGNAVAQITDDLFDFRNLTKELDCVVDYVKNKFQGSNIYLVGFSMGSSYGVKYLASKNGNEKIKGMVSISNPFNVFLASKNLGKTNSSYLTQQLLSKVQLNYQTLSKFVKKHNLDDYFNLEQLYASKSICEFNKHFTFNLIERVNKEQEEYFNHFSCHDDIQHLEKPVMFIQSSNDPISKKEFIPLDDIVKNINTIFVLTPGGAHVEYFVNLSAKRWYVDVVSNYIIHLENSQ